MIELNKVPKNPGVYLFKDKDGNVIYIGKAKSLKARVNSYFLSKNHGAKTQLLVRNISDAEFFIVDNEVEALLLENQLIKKNQPKYNITLKDSKTFAYILITKEDYPRILSTRKVGKKGNYFGPYTDGFLRLELVKLVVSLFKIRTCQKLPKRVCLNFYIGTCTAPCEKRISKDEYNVQVENAINFLNGKVHPVIDQLRLDMKQASSELKFETALKLKKQIEAVENLMERQKVERIVGFDQSIVAMQPVDSKAIIVVFTISKGVISGKKEFVFDYEDDILENFIKMYYSSISIPKEIIVSHEFWKSDEDKLILEEYLSKLKSAKVTLTYPYRGEKLDLVNMAVKNIQESSNPKSLEDIKLRLNLPGLPRVIECFDISNLSYSHVVGAMVQFVDGKPNTNNYRRFEIKNFTGQDDFAGIREIVYRRYFRLSNEKKQLPDLIVIDGGKLQLDAALSALKSVGVSIPIIALAKENEEIYTPGLSFPIMFEKNAPMMLLLRQIRDNVHRLALSYNKKKRQMKMRREFEEV